MVLMASAPKEWTATSDRAERAGGNAHAGDAQGGACADRRALLTLRHGQPALLDCGYTTPA